MTDPHEHGDQQLGNFPSCSEQGPGRPRGRPSDLAQRIRAELRANPNRSNKEIAAAVGADNRGHDYVGQIRRTGAADPVRKVSKIRMPEGARISDLVRRGLELERDGASTETAAKEVGLSLMRYREGRTIILLARQTLRPTDADIVQRALALMDETSSTIAASKLIAPLKRQTWGATRSRQRHNEKTLARRLEAFRKGIDVVYAACERVAEIELPLIAPAEIKSTLKRLQEATRHLNALRRRLQKGEHND